MMIKYFIVKLTRFFL